MFELKSFGRANTALEVRFIVNPVTKEELLIMGQFHRRVRVRHRCARCSSDCYTSIMTTSTAPVAPAPSITHTALIARMKAIVGTDNVLTAAADMAVYECDGFTIEKNRPDVVVFPTIDRAGRRDRASCATSSSVPFLAARRRHEPGRRLPAGRRRRDDRADADEAHPRGQLRDRYAVVEPGVVNVWLTNHLKPHGYHYAPDPSSQGACTIGGNVATNSGGPHTLKYGVTVNHVLGVELVLPDGRVVADRRAGRGQPGLRPDRRDRRQRGDVRRRHEGLGAASRATRRRTARCSASSRRSTTPPTPSATSSAPGIVPAALEMLDKPILAGGRGGVPLRLPARRRGGADHGGRRPRGRARRARPTASTAIAKQNSAREVRKANTEAERLLLWKCRKQAFGAIGRLGPELLHAGRRRAAHQAAAHPAAHPGASARSTTSRIANVFHAGDGNIHPILLFDERDAGPGASACWTASHEILDECIALRRQRDRRARHRRREDRLHAEAVHAGGPGHDGAAADGVQPGRPVQPRQPCAWLRGCRCWATACYVSILIRKGL